MRAVSNSVPGLSKYGFEAVGRAAQIEYKNVESRIADYVTKVFPAFSVKGKIHGLSHNHNLRYSNVSINLAFKSVKLSVDILYDDSDAMTLHLCMKHDVVDPSGTRKVYDSSKIKKLVLETPIRQVDSTDLTSKLEAFKADCLKNIDRLGPNARKALA